MWQITHVWKGSQSGLPSTRPASLLLSNKTSCHASLHIRSSPGCREASQHFLKSIIFPPLPEGLRDRHILCKQVWVSPFSPPLIKGRSSYRLSSSFEVKVSVGSCNGFPHSWRTEREKVLLTHLYLLAQVSLPLFS